MPDICEGLEKITHWNRSTDTSTKAHSLLNSVISCEFKVSTFALGEFLGTTLLPSRLLQSTKLDAVSAIAAYKDVLSVLQTKRENSDSVFQEIFEKAQNMASKLDFNTVEPRIARDQYVEQITHI